MKGWNKMTVDKQDILKALNTIKELCAEYDNCTTCPLRYDGISNVCYLKVVLEVPEEWDLNKSDINNGNNWRAFK